MTPTPVLITAPAFEPVESTDLASQLQAGSIPSDQSTRATMMRVAAREWFEVALDRKLPVATWELRLPYFTGTVIEIPYLPLAGVTSVKYLDSIDGTEQTLATSVYDVITSEEPGYIQLADGESWPTTDTDPEAVKIRFTAGYANAAAIPNLIRQGILMLAAHWYENREASVVGVSAMEVPLGVQAVVQASRAYRF